MVEIIEKLQQHWQELLLVLQAVFCGIKWLLKGRNVKTPIFESTIPEVLTDNHNDLCQRLESIKATTAEIEKEVWRQIIHSEFIPIEERLIAAQNYANAGYNGPTLSYVQENLLKRKGDKIE